MLWIHTVSMINCLLVCGIYVKLCWEGCRALWMSSTLVFFNPEHIKCLVVYPLSDFTLVWCAKVFCLVFDNIAVLISDVHEIERRKI